MELLQTILALLVTLGILVTVHEAGHFFLARYFGVRVLRFSLGMGPVLWRRQGADGTEFALSLLPIGGYVKMLEGEADGIASAPRQRAFSETHPAARIAIALGGAGGQSPFGAARLLGSVCFWSYGAGALC